MKLCLVLVFPLLAGAAIWPDSIGPYQKVSTSKPALSDKPLWDELGLKDSEAATYRNGDAKFTATAYEMTDSTAGLAAFDWQRPKDATSSNLADLAVETPKGVLLARGNYVLSIDGYKPTSAEVKVLLDGLRDVDTTPLPTLPQYLPSQGLVPNSERYLTGPVSLQRFDPGIPPSVAAFHLDAEAQLGVFHNPKGDLTLAIFNYPTNQMAMQKMDDFRKLSGAMVKRSGPLVAVTLSPPDSDFAERLLDQIRWEAQVTLHEANPVTPRQVGSLIVNIFILIGILLAFSTIAGLFVGGFRTMILRRKGGADADPMILLHLEER
jgi:uncharacterized protein DUF6599